MAIIRNPSREARQREARAQLRLRAALEPPVRDDLEKEFERTSKVAVSGFRSAGLIGATLAVATHGERLRDILTRHYRRTMDRFTPSPKGPHGV